MNQTASAFPAAVDPDKLLRDNFNRGGCRSHLDGVLDGLFGRVGHFSAQADDTVAE